MGVSTNALLVWGFDIGAVEELEEAQQELLEAWVGDKYSELEKIQEELGTELVWHGSDNYVCYIVAIKKPQWTAYRGSPEVVTERFMKIEPSGQEALEAFAKRLGLPCGPGQWLLASWWS